MGLKGGNLYIFFKIFILVSDNLDFISIDKIEEVGRLTLELVILIIESHHQISSGN